MTSRKKGSSHDSHRGKLMRFPPGNPVYARAWEEEDSLLDSLNELRDSVGVSSYDAIAKLSAPSLAPGKPAAAKIRSILAKGHIFSALSNDTPPESEVIYWDDGRAVSILNAFDLLGGVVAVARSSPAFAYLERTFPRDLWQNFIRWVEYLYPAYGRCHEKEIGGLNVVAAIYCAFEAISRLDTDGWRILLTTPAALPLLCDAWMNFDVHVEASDPFATACVVRIINAMDHLHQNLNDAGEATRAAFITEVHRLCRYDNARLWRRIARQTHYLTRLSPIPGYDGLWTAYFRITGFLAAVIDFRVERHSRKTMDKVMLAVRTCLTRKEWHDCMDNAVTLLYRMVAGGEDHVTLKRSIHIGLMTLLRDVSRTVPSCDVQSLASHIAAGAHFPDVFRAIRAQHRRFALDDSAPGRPRYGRRINSYDELATEIDRIESAARVARQIRKGRFHCHNEMGPHNREVRACPCAKDFYCSGSCQRMNRHLHRGSCDPENIWGMDGRLSVQDAMHIYGIASLFLQDHRDAISSALRTLVEQMGRNGLATLTLNLAYDGSQAYEFELRRPLLLSGWNVQIWVKMRLGGRTHIWDLPWSIALPPITDLEG